VGRHEEIRDLTGHMCLVEARTPALVKSRRVREHVCVDDDSALPGPSEEELGHHLRRLRVLLALDVAALATRSGLELEVIEAVEAGRHAADLDTLESLAAGLGLELRIIFALWEQQAAAQGRGN
jgi:hypothetical protein